MDASPHGIGGGLLAEEPEIMYVPADEEDMEWETNETPPTPTRTKAFFQGGKSPIYHALQQTSTSVARGRDENEWVDAVSTATTRDPRSNGDTGASAFTQS